jgi:NitT/TauT family transport system permease protein
MKKTLFSSKRKEAITTLAKPAADKHKVHEHEEAAASAAQKEYIKKAKERTILIWVFRMFIFIVFLALWEYSTQIGWLDSFIFSSPSKVLSTFLIMWNENQLYLHIGITIFETLVSFLIVVCAGIFLAILLWGSTFVSSVFEPYLVLLNSLPKSALAPLLIVWLGTSVRTIIVAGISVSIFGTIIHLYTSFHETDPDKIKLVRTLGGTQLQILTKVVLPSSIPQILSIMKVNIGLC